MALTWLPTHCSSPLIPCPSGHGPPHPALRVNLLLVVWCQCQNKLEDGGKTRDHRPTARLGAEHCRPPSPDSVAALPLQVGLTETFPVSPDSDSILVRWGTSIVQSTEKYVKRFNTLYYFNKGIMRTREHFMKNAISHSRESAYRPKNSRTFCPHKSFILTF